MTQEQRAAASRVEPRRGASRRQSDRALISLAEAVTAGLTPREVLDRVVAAAATLTAGEATVHLWLVGEDGQELRLAAEAGVRPGTKDVPMPRVLKIDEGLAGTIAQTREPVVVPSVVRDRRMANPAWARDQGLVSFAGVPLARADRLLGVLCLFTWRRYRFTAHEVDLLRSFASHAAVALENAALFEAATSRLRRLEALREIEEEILQQRDPDALLALISHRATELLQGDTATVYLLDEAAGVLRAHASYNVGEWGREVAIPVGEGVVGLVARRREGMIVNDYPRSTLAIAPFRDRDWAILAQPLLQGDSVQGVIVVRREAVDRPFTPADLAQLGHFAVLASIALENARLLRLASARAERVKAAAEEARRHEAEAVALAEVSRRFGATLRRESIVAALVEAAGRVVGETWAVLASDPESGGTAVSPEGHPLAAAAAGDTRARGLAPLGLSRELAAEVRATGRAVLLADVRDLPADHPDRPGLEQAGIRSLLLVPVIGGGVIHAVLAGSVGDEARRFTERELRLAESIADGAGLALENARLFEELARAYQDLQKAQQHLVETEKLRALGEMASGVAHDFNNALAAILGRVQLVLRRLEEPTLRRWLEIVEQAALDASQTVRRIQEFTRIRRDQPTETVDLHQVVRDAVEMTQARWRDETQSQGLDVRVALDLDPVPPVDGHPAELRQALTNLIFNAVDALPRGGTIAVTTRFVDAQVEVRVADNGVGMADEVRRRIFEPFFSTKGSRGTGLGLAMVYGIVSRHGGQVAVESKEGEGTAFTLRLPIGRGVPVARVPPFAVMSAAPARVLVIDDEAEVRDALADMLRTGNHEVVVAGHGAEGLERFREAAFDLVLTDLAMPGMSGWQVAQAVKAISPHVPVVLVTGWGVELPAEQLQAHGVDRVMTKPFKLDEVLEVVASGRYRAGGGSSPDPSAEERGSA